MEKLELEKGAPRNDKVQMQEQKIIIENRLAFLIGELSRYIPGDSQYEALDLEFKELMKEKKKLGERNQV